MYDLEDHVFSLKRVLVIPPTCAFVNASPSSASRLKTVNLTLKAIISPVRWRNLFDEVRRTIVRTQSALVINHLEKPRSNHYE